MGQDCLFRGNMEKESSMDRLSKKFGHHFDNVDPDKLVKFLRGGPEYLYANIEEYEKIIGSQVNAAFKSGWEMGRMMKEDFDIWVSEQNKKLGENEDTLH